MGTISTKEMQVLEQKSVDQGVSLLSLMENAGKQISETLQKKKELEKKKVLVVCYHGNNGGDGFVAARYLADICEVDVLFLGDEEKFKKEAAINYEKLSNRYDVQIFKEPDIDYDEYDVIIDAMLGTGIDGELHEPVLSVIDLINNSRGYKVSVDVPSGLNPDTGESAGKYVEPDLIITMHAIKKGLEKFNDKTVVIDIGIKES